VQVIGIDGVAGDPHVHDVALLAEQAGGGDGADAEPAQADDPSRSGDVQLVDGMAGPGDLE